MPDLSDLLKDAVGEIPEFDARALVAMQRRRRQLQAAGAAATTAAVALFVAVAFNHGSGGNVALKTRAPESTDATSTTDAPTASDSSTTIPTTTTSTPPVDTTGEGTTTILGSRGARAEDFTGTITAGPTTLRVGDTATLALSVRNVSDSVLVFTSFMNSSQLSETTRQPALVCAKLEHEGDVPQGGGPMNVWWPPFIEMQPGAETHVDASYSPTAEDVGTMTCMAVLTYTNGWRWPFVDTRIGSVPLVTITVLPADEATTTTSTGAPNTTVPTP